MWNDTVWRITWEKEGRLLREAEQERLANIARRAKKSKRSQYRLHLRRIPHRLWMLRWRVLPIMRKSPRKLNLLDTEEFPCVARYES